MPIWFAEIKELEKLYESVKGQMPGLEKELERLIRTDDENIILVYARRCLEVIVTDLCECDLKRERGTEPLKGVIDKLNKDKKIPAHIASSMYGLNELSTYGAHPKDFDPEQVKPVLINLDIIIKWYLKYKNIVTVDKTEVYKEKIRLRKEPLEEVTIKERTEVQEKPAKAGKRKLISVVTIVATLIIVAILTYPKIFKKDTLEKLRSSGERISVAVMPFQNMTNDTTWNIWQDGIQDMLVTWLSNNPEELSVKHPESVKSLIQGKGIMNYVSLTPSIARTVSRKLNADIFINGSIIQSGSKLILNAQLIDSKTEEILKPFQIEGPSIIDSILILCNSLSAQINNFLIIMKFNSELSSEFQSVSTNSPEALRYLITGRRFNRVLDYPTAKYWYLRAYEIDTNYYDAIIALSWAYQNMGMYEEAKKWFLKVYEKRDKMMLNQSQQIFLKRGYARYFGEPNENIQYLRQLLELDDQQPMQYYTIGVNYNEMFQYDKAIPELEKSLEIYNRWGIKPAWVPNYTQLGIAYHNTGQYKKENKLYKKAEKDFPDHPNIIYRQAVLALSEGEKKDANGYIEQLISLLKERSATEVSITTSLASIYSEAGILDKAEDYYHKALSLEPENAAIMNTLAYFLIDKDRNVDEGMELIDKALNLQPENYNYLHTKGWGLFKQDKYQEASKILQKSWDIRRDKAIYNHEAWFNLEAAKKAVAGLKQ